ncbi:hypothetical protein CYMTET_19326 [Cymbomonas tetramitiformis]|uniref:Uncharacterized protein n=1 Tax=Cymbomonas tetramitiformis TaxID=36881 RepID=A0AAE0G6V0_9CHLO|nr:hypothetical protein CYMTET_19326 [Cymbomonas tetramitiformis]
MEDNIQNEEDDFFEAELAALQTDCELDGADRQASEEPLSDEHQPTSVGPGRNLKRVNDLCKMVWEEASSYVRTLPMYSKGSKSYKECTHNPWLSMPDALRCIGGAALPLMQLAHCILRFIWVYIWSPWIFYPQEISNDPCCPYCDSPQFVKRKGWYELRPVASKGSFRYMLMVQKYRCGEGNDAESCGRTFSPLHSRVAQLLPEHVRNRLPCLVLDKSCVDKEFVQDVVKIAMNGGRFLRAQRDLAQSNRELVLRAFSEFALTAAARNAISPENRVSSSIFQRSDPLAVQDCEKYLLYEPSPSHLIHVLHQTLDADTLETLRIFLQSGSGRIWKFDWSFNLNRRIKSSTGRLMFESTFSILSEWNDPLAFAFLFTKSLSEIQPIIMALLYRYMHAPL